MGRDLIGFLKEKNHLRVVGSENWWKEDVSNEKQKLRVKRKKKRYEVLAWKILTKTIIDHRVSDICLEFFCVVDELKKMLKFELCRC